MKRGPKKKVCPPSVETMLGVVPDRQIAKQTGFSHITVARWREERGIGVSPRQKKNPKRHIFFGLVPDTELATAEGISRQRVSAQRAALGIPSPPHLTAYMAWSFLLRVAQEGKVGEDGVTIPIDLYRAIAANFPSET
jgi:hypothetical protein